jgi:hypothetical protein
MDAISNADRFVILLKQKLAERAQAKKPSSTARTDAKQTAGYGAVLAVAGRTARAGAVDRKLRRTIVEQLLADRFGAALVNEARFQLIIDQVSELMISDPDLNNTFSEIIVLLKGNQ